MKTPNVPQQEEPARVGDPHYDYHCDRCREVLMHKPAAPIAPLRGQDEPKLENEEDLIRHERLVSLKRLVEIRSLKAELTQALTSLAAAQKEGCLFPPSGTCKDTCINVRAEIAEASLAEAQKRIEELEKENHG